MGVAIIAKKTSVDGPVDRRFGRAYYLFAVDIETEGMQVYDNEVNLNTNKISGI